MKEEKNEYNKNKIRKYSVKISDDIIKNKGNDNLYKKKGNKFEKIGDLDEINNLFIQFYF